MKTNLEKYQICNSNLKDFEKSLPKGPGNYIVCLKKESSLFKKYKESNLFFDDFNGMRVCYVGKSNISLKNRLHLNHFNGNAGNSTLRMSFGVLNNFPLFQLGERKKYNFGKKNEAIVTKWINSNVKIFYLPNTTPNKIETELINKYQPALNLNGTKKCTKNIEFRIFLRKLRKESKS